MVMAPAYAYGGFVQLLAGMWEIVLGNGRSEASQMMFETMWNCSADDLAPRQSSVALPLVRMAGFGSLWASS